MRLQNLKRDRYYISGPMSGLPEFNYPAFEEAAVRLRSMGLVVESPHENFRGVSEDVRKNLTYRDYMVKAIGQMLLCNKIVLLPGWSKSPGARTELGLAHSCGHSIYYYRKELKRNPLLEIE